MSWHDYIANQSGHPIVVTRGFMVKTGWENPFVVPAGTNASYG